MIQVLACFTSERHLLFIQEPGMTKICHSHVHGIIQENVARLEAAI